MPFFGRPAIVRPYFGYRNTGRLVLAARALRARAPNWDRATTFAKLRTLFRHFASHEVAELDVGIEARSETGRTVEARCKTDREGFCHFDLALGAGWPLPERTSWETVTLRWINREGPQQVAGYVLAPGREQALGVVSDIDDTIMETGAHDLLSNWRRVLAQMPGERLPVPGAAALFESLGGGVAGQTRPATRRPFFYVSSSPWNLFDYLLAFKQAHGLPQGPMMLRDWGFDRATLGGKGHGRHKAAAVGKLVEFYEGMRFALIGDSTQADALAWAEAVQAHPDSIAGVFIRKAPGAAIGDEEQAALEAIDRAGVPLWIGENYDVEADFLRSLGFSDHGETQTVVEAARSDPAASPQVQAREP